MSELELRLWIDQVEGHDQTALGPAGHEDESLSVRVNVVFRVLPDHVIGKVKQHLVSPDRDVVTDCQLMRDQLSLRVPVEELLPIGSPDWIARTSRGNQPLFPWLREGLNVDFESTGLVGLPPTIVRANGRPPVAHLGRWGLIYKR